MKQVVRNISVTMRTHNIFVEVSVWPCNDGTMRAPVPLKADNPAFNMRLIANDEEKTLLTFLRPVYRVRRLRA